MTPDVPGTILLDGGQAQKRFALNRMCFSFNSVKNREPNFLKNEKAYCRKFGLTEPQREAVKSRKVLAMIEAGGNVYTSPSSPAFSPAASRTSARQTRTTVEAFKQKLAAAGS